LSMVFLLGMRNEFVDAVSIHGLTFRGEKR
jgi:hypothetical protein